VNESDDSSTPGELAGGATAGVLSEDFLADLRVAGFATLAGAFRLAVLVAALLAGGCAVAFAAAGFATAVLAAAAVFVAAAFFWAFFSAFFKRAAVRSARAVAFS
jgi:hypothetical protein